jgi:hypothetical protein
MKMLTNFVIQIILKTIDTMTTEVLKATGVVVSLHITAFYIQTTGIELEDTLPFS